MNLVGYVTAAQGAKWESRFSYAEPLRHYEGVKMTLGFFVVATLLAGKPALVDSYFWFTTIDVAGTTSTYADVINNLGRNAGTSTDTAAMHGLEDAAWAFTAASPAHSPIVQEYAGVYGDRNGGDHGFLGANRWFTVSQRPNTTVASSPLGIDNRGQVVGWFFTGGNAHGYLYEAGALATIDDPNATPGTFVYRINDNGRIVGTYKDAAGYQSFVDTGGVFTTINDPNVGTGSTFAYGINNSGQPVPPVATPESGTITLLVAALVGFAIVARRDVKSSAAK